MIIIGSPNKEHEKSLRLLGEFSGADSVEYQDWGKAESYILRKGDNSIELKVDGNSIDGGYMNVGRCYD